MLRELEYEFAEGSYDSFLSLMSARRKQPFFANARTVRNAIDHARMAAAIRVFNEKMDANSDGMVTEQDLKTIKPEDLTAMR